MFLILLIERTQIPWFQGKNRSILRKKVCIIMENVKKILFRQKNLKISLLKYSFFKISLNKQI